MRSMPKLGTERLLIRPFTPNDTITAHQNALSIGWVDTDQSPTEQLATKQTYIHWCSLNHQQLARLDQPPYGDRAVTLKANGALIGTCGLVPYVAALGVFPYFGGQQGGRALVEMGLMWTIAAGHQKQGYGTEVARALIDYTLNKLNLHHIIATTEYDNLASQKVMQNAGMHMERNPFDEPPWLQVLGVIEYGA